MTLGHFKCRMFPRPWALMTLQRGSHQSLHHWPASLAVNPQESMLVPLSEVMLTHSPVGFQTVPGKEWAPSQAGTPDVTEES